MSAKTISVAKFAVCIVVFASFVAGCGRETVPTAPGAKAPTRIVSLSPTATEMLFAIHAGRQVIAVDDQSNYPPNAPRTKLSGFQPNVEAIANYRPDLVVYDGTAKTLAAGLRALKIPVLAEPAAKSLDDTYSQIAQLSLATGHGADGARLITRMRGDIHGIVSSAPKLKRPATYYHELDNTYFTVTSKTFIGQVYKLLGLSNIADPADKAATGYPQLSSEYIVRSSPDLIFLADTKCCKQSAQTVSARPGWSSISAIRNSNIVTLDDDIASRWGPRVVDLLRTVAAAIRDGKSLPS